MIWSFHANIVSCMSVAHTDSTTAETDKRSIDEEFEAADVDPTPGSDSPEDAPAGACLISSQENTGYYC